MFDLPPFDPNAEILVASRGMSKGIAQTDGPQVVPKLLLQIGPVQVGGQWKNVTSPVAEGEAAVFVNATREFGSLELTAGITYKWQTDAAANTDDDAFEFNAAATPKFGKVTMRLSGVYSPDDFGGARRSLYVEGGPSLEVSKAVRFSANIGRRQRQGSPDYTSFNAGATVTLFKDFNLDLRYYDTAQSELGEAYHGRVVVSGRWRF